MSANPVTASIVFVLALVIGWKPLRDVVVLMAGVARAWLVLLYWRVRAPDDYREVMDEQ